MSMNDFQIMQKLGEGAYSSVYKVKRLNDGGIYALKKVRMLDLSDKEKENALNEVRILASIKSTNIIAYKEAFIDEPSQSLWYFFCPLIKKSIVMEFADNGDLFQKITEHQKNSTCFTEDEIWHVFIQTVRGLRALHDLKILHRDMKSANVFLFKDATAKLGDLNVSKVAKKGLGYTQTGTPYYASPEVWRDQPYDMKSDIWSLGCVLYEIITLKPPFRAPDMQSLYKKVLKGIYPRIPTSYSQDLANIVKHLLQVSPHLRPTCSQILKMPAVVRRIERLFPEVKPEDSDENILLSTIRVPKNLLFLTDRLPKPNYHMSEDDAHNRHTTTGDYLPEIRHHYKSTPYKVYMGNRGKYKKILGEKQMVGEINLRKVNPVAKRPRIKAVERSKIGNDQGEVVVEKRTVAAKEYDYAPDFNDEDNEEGNVNIKNNAKVKSIKKVNDENEATPKKPLHKHKSSIHKKESISKLDPQDENPKEIHPIRYKYTKRKEKQNLESVPPPNHSSIVHDYSPYIPDSYIRQIVSKRNPIIKPISHNLQMLANIYSGNPQQLSLIARRLQSIKLPKVLLKRDEYSLSPYMQRGLRGAKVMDNYEKIGKVKELTPLKPRLEPLRPVKLLNYAKDLQSVGLKAHALPPNSISKS